MGKSAITHLFNTLLVTLTIAFTCIVCFGAFTKSIYPIQSPLLAVFEIAIPFMLIASVVISLLWLFKKKIWFIIPCVGIAFNWSYFKAMVAFNEQKEMPQEAVELYEAHKPNGYLTVASYNIHGFGDEIRGYSCKELARILQEKHVDVICLQEFSDKEEFTVDSIKKTLNFWPHSYIPIQTEKRINKLPLAIFSRFPINNKKYFDFEDTANGAMAVDVEVTDEKIITLVNCHLETTGTSQHSRRWMDEFTMANGQKDKELKVAENIAEFIQQKTLKRIEQAQEIEQYIRQSPNQSVCCGDFNSLPSSYIYHLMTQFLEDGFINCGKGYANTFRYGKKLFRIDYIFHDKFLEGLSYDIYKEELCSDHNLSIMTLKVF